MFTLSVLLLNLVTTTSDPKDICMSCLDVTLRCIKSHLSHVVSLSSYMKCFLHSFLSLYCMCSLSSLCTYTFVMCYIKYQPINQSRTPAEAWFSDKMFNLVITHQSINQQINKSFHNKLQLHKSACCNNETDFDMADKERKHGITSTSSHSFCHTALWKEVLSHLWGQHSGHFVWMVSYPQSITAMYVSRPQHQTTNSDPNRAWTLINLKTRPKQQRFFTIIQQINWIRLRQHYLHTNNKPLTYQI